MKRFAFYKEYYRITNRIYADHTIWSAKDREQVWRKGQIYTSKTERGIFVVAQYCILLVTGVLLVTENSRYGIIGFVMFLLSALITDFSIVKIEMLYHVFSRSNPYASLLYKAFAGKVDDFWCLILPATKKKVSGFVRMNRSKFIAQYRVVFRKKRESVTLIISPFRIRLRSETCNAVFSDSTATLMQIADGVSEVLNSL